MIIRRQQDLSTNAWSGGTTTGLFLFPEGSSYAERNFDVRISSATVELETSEFTPLPGYSRILMVLAGTLLMRHETEHGIREVSLRPFEQAAFSGDWKTTGFGKVVDFNVLFRSGYEATVSYHELKTGFFPVAGEPVFLQILFLVSGKMTFGDVQCVAGEVVVFEDELPLQGCVTVSCQLISVTVFRSGKLV